MTDLTSQEVFDFSARHLIKQGRPARRLPSHVGKVSCQYHTDEGLKCGIGCFIPDDRYHPAMDSGDFHVTQVLTMAGLKSLDDQHNNLLLGLRWAHDVTTDWPVGLKAKLLIITKCFDLNPGVLDEKPTTRA